MATLQAALFSTLLFAQLIQVVSAATALATSDLFTISFDSNVAGNCVSPGQARIDALSQNALDVLTAGESAAKNYADWGEEYYDQATRLLDAFFINPSEDEVSTILDRYETITSFLTSGFSTGDKPYLFCGDSWALRKSMSDQMYDDNGNPMPDYTTTNAAGQSVQSTYEIRDDSLMVEEQNRVTLQLQENPLKGYEQYDVAYPYWSSVLGQYVFDRAYGTDPTLGKCSSGDEGFSNYQADSGLPFMVLCDKSFQSNGRLPLSVAPVPIWSNQFTDNTPDTAAQEIYEILPECITFAHELFHLVLGNDLSVPSMGEEYSFPQIMGIQPRADGQAPMTTEGNLANPETYALVAAAFQYTMTDKSGNDPVEYYTGWCTVPAADDVDSS